MPTILTMQHSRAKVTPDTAEAAPSDADQQAQLRLEELATHAKGAQRRLAQTLCLSPSPDVFVENMKNLMTAIGVTCALLWGVNVGNLREPVDFGTDDGWNEAAFQAFGILSAISTVSGFLAICFSMSLYVQLDLIPDDSSLVMVEAACVDARLFKWVMVPQFMFYIQGLMLLATIGLESVFVYGVDQPAGYVTAALCTIGGPCFLGYWVIVMQPRFRGSCDRQFEAMIKAKRVQDK